MQIDRRAFLLRTTVISAMASAPAWMPAPVFALGEDEAASHVRETLDELIALVNSPGEGDAKAPELRSLMERRAAMPQIARFAAGTAWRSMDEDQQSRYSIAFSKFISRVYAERFRDYGSVSGSKYKINNVVDAGKKGLLVKSQVFQSGGPPIVVDWLVTDRPGRTVVADIVIEGISMLVTEREQINGMLEARGGNIDKLIADLGA